MTEFGCLYLLLITVIFLPVYLVLFGMPSPTTILFTIFAAAVLSYALQKLKRWFNNSSKSSNGSTRRKNEEMPVRGEVKWRTKRLLGNPDLDCEATEDNQLTSDESWKIHDKRLEKYRRSKIYGEMVYMGPKGGIYTITARGNRVYR